MNDRLLHRALSEPLGVDGRTLIGVAIPWEKATLVSDYGGPKYLEDFAARSADKTLRQNPEPRPVFFNHGHARGDAPIGVVHYSTSPSSLLFRAHVSKTRAGDEALELARDGAASDVSAGFFPVNTTRIRTAAGTVHRRTEINLQEMSLASTGFGQIPGAKVLAIRADASQTFGDIQDAVTDAIEHKLFGADGAPDGVYVYLPGIGEGWAVYAVEGGALDKPELNDTWRVDYVVGADGTVTVSDTPVRVSEQWIAVEAAVQRSGLTPRLDRQLRLRGKTSPA